ncbi:alpha/beta hydrolase family protein [Neorhodopirellula pilleata]|nr:alpha/beta hydrolase [Neorhodopirellula pilleata]
MTTTYHRRSYRVEFDGGSGFRLAGIVDRPSIDPNDVVDGPLPDGVPTVVFSHCFTCSKDLKAITRISRRLAELGVAVLRFDMTGLGGSSGDFSRTSFSTNLADLSAAITFATDSLGPVGGLIGHSFGGAASLGVAAGIPHSGSNRLSEPMRSRIAAVVTIAAPSDTQHLATLLETMNPAIATEGIGEVSIGGRSWTIRKEMTADFRSHRLADSLNQIRCPVLAFHSPVDQTVSFDHALRIAGLIHDPDGMPACSIIALPRADHLFVNEPRDAIFVAETSAAFLRRYAQNVF